MPDISIKTKYELCNILLVKILREIKFATIKFLQNLQIGVAEQLQMMFDSLELLLIATMNGTRFFTKRHDKTDNQS